MTRIFTTVVLAMALSAAVTASQSPARGSAAREMTIETPLNLNTATAAQLEALPGIGPATAQRIVEYRQKSGGFKKVEELMNVRGIGEASFLKLKSLISVTPPKTDRASAQSQ